MSLVTTLRISAVSPHGCMWVFRYGVETNNEYRPQQHYQTVLGEGNGVFIFCGVGN
jgi:hypothetical protein